MKFSLARTVKKAGGVLRAKPASARDRANAVALFIGKSDAGPMPPEAADTLAVIQFLISSDAFLCQAEDVSLRNEPVGDSVVEWAGRLPLTDDAKVVLRSAISRADALETLFADPVFLSAVMAGQTFAFSPGAFLRGAPVADEDRKFIEVLIERKSALVDPRRLAQWGLDREQEPEHLARYGRLPWFSGAPLFDAEWYGRQRGLAFGGWFEALRDYVENGEALGLSPNAYINARGFLEGNVDLTVGAGSQSWLEHLAARDAVERRSAACHFDAAHYASQVSPKTWDPFGSPLAHFVAEGWRQGVSPNSCFDAVWYLRTYADARKAIQNGECPDAFSHFVLKGERDGLRPSSFFDPDIYIACNSDLKAAKMVSPFRHFWSQGRHEMRDAGDPSIRATVRAFQKRLPRQSDVIVAGRLVEEDLRPEAVWLAAQRPAQPNLADLIQSGESANTLHRAVITQALAALGRPHALIEHGARQQIHEGDVIRLYVSGEASLGGARLTDIRARSPHVGHCEHFTHMSLANVDVAARLGGGVEALRSGFMAWFEFSARDLEPGPQNVNLELVFELSPGVEYIANQTVTVEVLARPRRSRSNAAVQVAMASYNPPRDAFRAQVESILANDGAHLVISDDASPAKSALSLGQFAAEPRVDIDVNAVNTGFIINFERSLYMCSDAAETILFSDQDDLWRADKIQSLTEALKGDGVVCAFSDMRITTADGEVISPTFWNSRNVHYFDPLTVGVANTVTGAASAFPADLVELLTPFPRYTSGLYHDQWLSVLSAAVGRIAYVERPLYDYVQHGGNVLGFSGSRLNDTAKWSSILKQLKRVRRSRQASERDVELAALAIGQFVGVMQRFVMWREALSRAPTWADDGVRDVAEQLCAAIAGQPFQAVRTKRGVARLARRAGGREGLLAIDALIESMLMARHLVEIGVISPERLSRQRQDAMSAASGFECRMADRTRTEFDRKIERVPARGAEGPTGLRVNLFLPELTLRHFFGGYHSKISLITRLRERGVATRLILVDEPRVNADAVAEIVGAFPELERGLADSDIEAIGLRNAPLAMGPGDAMMATTWWSALVVDDLRRQLGRERFLYFVQEYEPFTFSLGTWYRAAEQTYDLPHDAVFSTEVLEQFFRDQKAGVFADETQASRFLAFRNPITGLRGMPRKALASGRRPRLLFYARPQATESRNMYEFGLAALRLAAAELGEGLDGWDLVGVGADRNAALDIGSGRTLNLIKKLDSYSYREMLASSDVGLSLMYTPHPSLVPLEMAAAGMITVTNACMSKTAASFDGISPLIRVAEPEVNAIAAQLSAAIRQVMAGPVDNPGVDWPVNPAEAFPDEWLDKYLQLAERSLKPA